MSNGKLMKNVLFPILIAVLPMAVQAADDLAQLQENYTAMRELKMAPLVELQNKYRKKLNTILEKAKSDGALDAALMIQKELEGFVVKPIELQGNVPPDMAQAQQVYLSYKERILEGIGKDIASVDMRYLAQLDALEKKLTQAGDLSSALRVRQAGDAVRKEVATRHSPADNTRASGPMRSESVDSLKSDLIAYWPLDRDFNDRKGRHDGVTKGTGVTFAEGKVGKAMRLTQDCNIAVPHDAALNLNHPFTISLWISLDNSDGRPGYNRGIISKSAAAWMLYIEPKKSLCFRVEGGGTQIEPKVPIDRIPEGKWTHIAATFDGQEAKIFVNGTEAAAQKSAAAFVPNVQNGVEVRLGSNVTHWYWWFYGLIDEVRIYKKALTGTEISAVQAFQ